MYDRLKKILPIVLIVIVAIFSVLYLFISRQHGVEYQDTLYFPVTEGDTTVYSAKVGGQPASFTVQGDTVTYRWGDTVYGPYTVREDSAAIPSDEYWDRILTGVEIRKGDQVLFRGGYDWNLNLLVKENGQKSVGTSSPEHPNLLALIRFSQRPEADTHRGAPLMWFLGLLLAGVTVLLIRFDDAIFRFNLFFRVRHPEDAEPSDWELTSRVLSWLAFTVFSFGVFLAGLIIIS
ncbi:hypothetical protein [Flavonifractor sp. AGMB03687]|uniref:hypothetical protein n=1 Tax=Flavonifractor sp. AGMB03687 TaxID=2785133 RepID=UPI001AE0A901|nr:hypothetical protein [Flavonifractor sp. AGMB03687]